MQQSSLRAVREPLIDRLVAGKHDSHVVRPVEHLLSFKPTVEVTGKVKQPRTLRPNFAADKAHALVPIPVLSACSSGSHLGLDLHSMAVGFRDSAGDAAIPRVAVHSNRY